jgi:hypothetical protein
VTELQALVQEAAAQRHDSRLVLGTCSAASRARFGRGRFAVCTAVVCVAPVEKDTSCLPHNQPLRLMQQTKQLSIALHT